MSTPSGVGWTSRSVTAREASSSASVTSVAERIRIDTIGGPRRHAPVAMRRQIDGGCSTIAGSTPRAWDMSTPMTGPVFIWRMTSPGKFFSTAPSTSTCPSMIAGGMMPGIAMEARMARRIRPRR